MYAKCNIKLIFTFFSGNTIRVLQLVYGAQLRRLLYVADLTQGLLEGVDVALIRSDPQRFADLMV
jgi:hypothetical protein